jgi:hypothetical protein
MTFTETLENPSFVSLAKQLYLHLYHLRSDAGNLTAFWMSYLDLFDVMLNLLRSSREGNWAMICKRSTHDTLVFCI